MSEWQKQDDNKAAIKPPAKSKIAQEEALITEWLLKHPNFFRHQKKLVETLKIPHLLLDNSGKTLSLLEYQVKVLREKNQKMQDYTRKLVRRARKNQVVIHQLHDLALALMSADSLEQVIIFSQEILRTEFTADVTTLRLIAYEQEQRDPLFFIQPNDRNLVHFNRLFEKHKVICGHIKPEQTQFLFGHASQSIKSAVLIPLYDGHDLGFLALGSEDEQRFRADEGTVFLSQLGQLVSRAISKQL